MLPNELSVFVAAQRAQYAPISKVETELNMAALDARCDKIESIFGIDIKHAESYRRRLLTSNDLIRKDIAQLNIRLDSFCRSILDRAAAAFIETHCSEVVNEVLTSFDRNNLDPRISNQPILEAFALGLIDDIGRSFWEVILFEINLVRESNIDGIDFASPIEGAESLVRSQDFLQYLAEKYPVMKARATRRIACLGNALARWAQRAAQDLEALARLTDLPIDGLEIISFDRGAGDSHHGADGVGLLTLSSKGIIRKVIYKPRPVDCEIAFNRFLEWIHEISPDLELPFKIIALVERDNYGWMEFVEHVALPSEGSQERYFRRYGAIASVLEFLNATDIHYENLIAHGEYPVVVDLETILQPSTIRNPDANVQNIGIMDLEFFTGGPFFTGMFEPIFLRGSLDGSPLAGPMQIDQYNGDLKIGDDGKLALKIAATKKIDRHCPKLNGSFVSGYDHTEAILDGFRDMSRNLLKLRSAALTYALPTFFSGLRIRVVFRETARYGQLIRTLNSPYCLESASNTDEFLFKLLSLQVEREALVPLFISEYHACLDGDVPYFNARVGSTSIFSEDKRIEGIELSLSGIEETRQRILRSSHASINRALVALRYSLAIKLRERQKYIPGGRVEGLPCDPHELLKIIQHRVFRSDGQTHSLDLVLGNDQSTKHRALGRDIYMGLPGVLVSRAGLEKSLFGDVGGDTRIMIDEVLDQFDAASASRLGACVGLGGMAYLAMKAADWGDSVWRLDQAGEWLRQATALAYMDRHFDIYSGLAGAVAVGASVALRRPNSDAAAASAQLALTLLGHADRSGTQLAWKSSIPSRGASTGFAHGVAGIGYAFARVYRCTDDVRFLAASLGVHEFLNGCRSDAYGWRDASHAADSSLLAWCHGAPGIGLLYRELVDLLPEREDLKTCLSLARRHAVKALNYENESLCHGALGNAEVFLGHATDPGVAAGYEQEIDALCQRLDSMKSVRCGNVMKHQSLGLFTGIAGLAYQRQRLKNPESLPSVLTFE